MALALGGTLLAATALAAGKPHAKYDKQTSKIACSSFTKIRYDVSGIEVDTQYGSTPHEYLRTLTQLDSTVTRMVKRLDALRQSKTERRDVAALATQLASFSKGITAMKAAVHARSKSAFRAAAHSMNKDWKQLPKRVVAAGIDCSGATPVTGRTSPLDATPTVGTPYGS